MVLELKHRSSGKSWIKNTLLASSLYLASFFSPTVKAEANTLDAGIGYSRIDVSDGGDLDIEANRVDMKLNIPLIAHLDTSVYFGIQSFHLNYSDFNYGSMYGNKNGQGRLENIALKLTADPTPYIGVRIAAKVPLTNSIKLGPAFYYEHAVQSRVRIDRFEARASTYRREEDHVVHSLQDLSRQNIANIEFTNDRIDYGFSGQWESGNFDLTANLMYTKFWFDLEVKYTDSGRRLIELTRVTNKDIVNGDFKKKKQGWNFTLTPSYKFNSNAFIEINFGFVVTEDNKSYVVGSSMGFSFSNPLLRK